MAKTMRLDKFLVEMGTGTRSQVKELAKKGRIRVNGVTVKKTEEKVDPEKDTVTVDGTAVAYAGLEYYMLNKPQGVVSATEDKVHKTVIDLVRSTAVRRDLFPVGRLDIDTQGLLLITNDGDLAHRLLSPKRHVDKRYYAKVAGVLPEDAREQFEKGLTLSDGTETLPAVLEILGEQKEPEAEVIVTIREGKFHQVKRMFEVLGCRVVFLKRISMGSLVLDESLKPGEYRPLSKEEIDALQKGEG